MTIDLEEAIKQLYMRSKLECSRQDCRIHYSVFGCGKGAYVAILREDGDVEEEFFDKLDVEEDESGYYTILAT